MGGIAVVSHARDPASRSVLYLWKVAYNIDWGLRGMDSYRELVCFTDAPLQSHKRCPSVFRG